MRRWFSRRREQLYAWWYGYFWLPCPLCGERFGGHEIGGDLYEGKGRGRMTCSDCAPEAERLSVFNLQRDPPCMVVIRLPEESP